VALLACLGMAALPISATAAQFKWVPPDPATDFEGTVLVDGTIEPDDHKRLLEALGEHKAGTAWPIYMQLNSGGGNYEEALRIVEIVRSENLSTRLGPKATCLSACAIIFMSGSTHNNSFYIKSRSMHPTAILGFHAPDITIKGGNFDSADLEDAYSRALEQVGKALMSVARYRDESWSNPLIKPGLINEMMIRRGKNFFYIDTVGIAAEYEVELDDALGPPRMTAANHQNACLNAIAQVTDSSVAEDALKYWLGIPEVSKSQKRDSGTGRVKYTFELNRHKGRFCDVTPSGKDNQAEVGIGVGGTDQTVFIPDWYFWPSNTKLAAVPTRPADAARR
jgi:ATP-dependent protease ClpP protease subunit